MDIPVGATHTSSVMVDETNVASAVGSGLVDVFATPMMVALVELTAAKCLEKYLEEGEVSVGTRVDVTHSAPTPVAMRVTAKATVKEVQSRTIFFDVAVHDEKGEVGKGLHTRVIVNKTKFMEKALAKRA